MKTHGQLRALMQQELPVRLANRIAHLDTLPHIDSIDHILSVRADFVDIFSEVREARPHEFSNVIRRWKKINEDLPLRMAWGMKEWKGLQREHGEPDKETSVFADNFLDRFFLSRIGMEMLGEQYVALVDKPTGFVDQHCDPCKVCQKAATLARRIAKAHLKGDVPEVNVSFYGAEETRTLPLIPQYLMYIVLELLKNSLRAVGELHEALYRQHLKKTPMGKGC